MRMLSPYGFALAALAAGLPLPSQAQATKMDTAAPARPDARAKSVWDVFSDYRARLTFARQPMEAYLARYEAVPPARHSAGQGVSVEAGKLVAFVEGFERRMRDLSLKPGQNTLADAFVENLRLQKVSVRATGVYCGSGEMDAGPDRDRLRENQIRANSAYQAQTEELDELIPAYKVRNRL